MNEREPSVDRTVTADDLLAATALAAARHGKGRKRRRGGFWSMLMMLLWTATAIALLALVAAVYVPLSEEEDQHALASLTDNVETVAIVAFALFGASILSMIVFWLRHRVVSSARLTRQLKALSRTVEDAGKRPS